MPDVRRDVRTIQAIAYRLLDALDEIVNINDEPESFRIAFEALRETRVISTEEGREVMTQSVADAYRKWKAGERDGFDELTRAKIYAYANAVGDDKTAMEIIDASEDD